MTMKVTMIWGADLYEIDEDLIKYDWDDRAQIISTVVEIRSQNNSFNQILICKCGAEFLVNTQDILNITLED